MIKDLINQSVDFFLFFGVVGVVLSLYSIFFIMSFISIVRKIQNKDYIRIQGVYFIQFKTVIHVMIIGNTTKNKLQTIVNNIGFFIAIWKTDTFYVCQTESRPLIRFKLIITIFKKQNYSTKPTESILLQDNIFANLKLIKRN